MMATVGPAQRSSQDVHRKRRSHPKVKTGCITCKIRKKKCDETKPDCLRCTSTGRKCDGYQERSPGHVSPTGVDSVNWSQSNLSIKSSSYEVRPLKKLRLEEDPSSSLYRRNTSVHRSPALYSFESLIEGQCFDFFRCESGPQFGSYFDSLMFNSFATKAAMHHPAILQAAAAVGAAHRRFAFGITREAFEYCAIADKLHRKALRSLREVQISDGNISREVKMITCVLLGLFEGFQANYEKTIHHLITGLRHILDRPFRIVHSDSRYFPVKMTPEAFTGLFNRLKSRATELFDSQINYFCHYGDAQEPPDMPRHFTSLEHARDTLFTDAEWILQVPVQLWQDASKCQKLQTEHVSRLLKWSVAYAETVRTSPNRSEREIKACKLLKLTRNTTYLLLYVVLLMHENKTSLALPDTDLFTNSNPNEKANSNTAANELWQMEDTGYDVDIHLALLTVLSESVFNENSEFAYGEHSISFDSGVGPPRLPDPDPEPQRSSAKTRHLVKSMIANNSDVEADLLESLGIYGIAERLSAIEEHAVIAALKGHLIPAHHKPKWVDITFFLESRKLLLQYCRPDEYGLGTIWERQWMVY